MMNISIKKFGWYIPEILYNKEKKTLPINQLGQLFMSAGWIQEPETEGMILNFNLPFINSTLVISAWHEERLVGVVRVLSDKNVELNTSSLLQSCLCEHLHVAVFGY
jgi:hypothetical protein